MAKEKRGGARPGSGRPKGTLNASTITKEMAREALRQIVLAEMTELVGAQIAQAKGIRYMVVRQKSTGKFLRVGEQQAANLNDDEEIIEIWEKDPSTPAFTDLMNRAIDKPIEMVEQHHSGALVIKHELSE